MSVPTMTAYHVTSTLLGRRAEWRDGETSCSGEIVGIALVTQFDGERTQWVYLVHLDDGRVESLWENWNTDLRVLR